MLQQHETTPSEPVLPLRLTLPEARSAAQETSKIVSGLPLEEAALTLPVENEATQEIQAWLEDVAHSRYRRPLSGVALIAALAALPSFGLVNNWIYGANYTWQYAFAPWHSLLSLAYAYGIPIGLLVRLNQTQRAQQEIADDLKLGPLDPQWIASLTQELNAPSTRVRAAASRLLTRLLPRLKSQDAPLLGPLQRRQLAFVLHGNLPHDEALTLAILKALERVGDSSDLPVVDYLAQSVGWMPRQRRIRIAAVNCLSAIETRLEEQQREAMPPVQAAVSTQAATGAVENQLALLEEEARTHQPGMRNKFLVASWLTIVPYTGLQAVSSVHAGEWLYAGIWAGFCGLSTQLHRFALSREMQEAARQLASHNHVRGVGPLAEALEWPEPAIQEVAANALTNLLPQLQATDAGLLSAKQRASLGRYLKMSNVRKHGPLVMAILKAFEQVGDAEAVPYVRRMAEGVALTPAQKRAKNAAIDCLPYLQGRADLTRASQTLLRASGLEDAGSGAAILLRPASGVDEAEPRHLLRAVPDDSA